MKLKALRDAVLQHEEVNFLITNRVPRIALTRLMGWYSRIESPWLTRLSIALWQAFGDLDLSDAARQDFRSVHECFTRALRPGARPVDVREDLLCSPCDAIVGECGAVQGRTVFQAKGYPYTIDELFGDAPAADTWADGTYVTLRLTSAMYHRFHAPHDGRLEHVTHFAGDTWNVNPIALKRIERLYCRNERAVLRLRLAGGHRVALVPVAAILVAGLRLHAMDLHLHLRYRGPRQLTCNVPLTKGAELGWFEHGSTIIVFAPSGFTLAPGITPGHRVRMGEPLMRLPG